MSVVLRSSCRHWLFRPARAGIRFGIRAVDGAPHVGREVDARGFEVEELMGSKRVKKMRRRRTRGRSVVTFKSETLQSSTKYTISGPLEHTPGKRYARHSPTLFGTSFSAQLRAIDLAGKPSRRSIWCGLTWMRRSGVYSDGRYNVDPLYAALYRQANRR